jgi:hypothetical protein
MCMMVYIAAEAPLPLVHWDDQHPGFHVEELNDENPDEKNVRCQFTKPYIYYVGSFEGCGCGFNYGQVLNYEEDDKTERRRSAEDLSNYLSVQISRWGPIELFACQVGDEGAPPVCRGTITPDDIGGERFWFEEKHFLLIVPNFQKESFDLCYLIAIKSS